MFIILLIIAAQELRSTLSGNIQFMDGTSGGCQCNILLCRAGKMIDDVGRALAGYWRWMCFDIVGSL
jgi:hypothetical protein